MKAGWPRIQGRGIVSRTGDKTLSLGRDPDVRGFFIVSLSSRSQGLISRHAEIGVEVAIRTFVDLYREHMAPTV